MPAFSYLDTSFLVKAYIAEEDSLQVQQHVRDIDNTLYISPLTDLEMAATLPKRLDPAASSATWAVYQGDRSIGVYAELALTDSVWRLVADLLLQQSGPTFLGALDALHLATALFYGATHMATYDRRLVTAAKASGLTVVGARP